MRINRRRLLASVAAASLSLSALGMTAAHAADASKKSLTLGATVGYNYDVLKLAIEPQLKKQGYSVRLVEFNDYVQPNMALAQNSLDANLFQHLAYLNRFKSDQHLNLTAIAQSITAPMGVYSSKRKNLAALQDGDSFSIPNDPSNLARALLLLQDYHIIKVDSKIDPLRVTVHDVVENAKHVKFVEVEAAQLPRTLGDVQYAVVPGNFAISSGMKLTDSLAIEHPPVQYQQIVAVRSEDADKPWAKDLAADFHSAFFKEITAKDFAGYVIPTGLPAQK